MPVDVPGLKMNLFRVGFRKSEKLIKINNCLLAHQKNPCELFHVKNMT